MRLWLMVAAALTSTLLAAPRFAAAAPFHVTMLRSPNASPLVRELTARAAGELVAAGFSIEVVDRADADADAGGGGGAAMMASAAAAFAVGPAGEDPGDALVAINLGSRQIYRAIVARADVDEVDGGRVLAAAAVHAVAALQAALVAAEPRASAAPEPLAVAAVSQPRAPPPDAGRGWGAGVGMSLLQSLQGLSPTLSPVIRLSYRGAPRDRMSIAVGIRAMSLGSSASASAPAGSARVWQDLVLGDLVIALRPTSRVHPLLTGGAGAYRMRLQGSGAAPFVGQTDRSWGAAVAVGLGLSVDLSRRASLLLESDALFVWPQPVVQIDTVEAGRAGRPSLAHSLGLLWWF